MRPKSLMFSLTSLTLGLVVLMSIPARTGHYENLPLVVKARQGQLTVFQQKAMQELREQLDSAKAAYTEELADYLRDAGKGEVPPGYKQGIFCSGVYVLQMALEYYSFLSLGDYPENLDVLLCANLLDSYPYDPYSRVSVKLYTLGEMGRVDSGLVYVPEYDNRPGKPPLVCGYWIIAISPDGPAGERPRPSLLKELPGEEDLPKRAFAVFESHMD